MLPWRAHRGVLPSQDDHSLAEAGSWNRIKSVSGGLQNIALEERGCASILQSLLGSLPPTTCWHRKAEITIPFFPNSLPLCPVSMPCTSPFKEAGHLLKSYPLKPHCAPSLFNQFLLQVVVGGSDGQGLVCSFPTELKTHHSPSCLAIDRNVRRCHSSCRTRALSGVSEENPVLSVQKLEGSEALVVP